MNGRREAEPVAGGEVAETDIQAAVSGRPFFGSVDERLAVDESLGGVDAGTYGVFLPAKPAFKPDSRVR